MSCDLCEESLENTKTIAFPCCDRVCHSMCALQKLGKDSYNTCKVECKCGYVIYTPPVNSSWEDPTPQIAAVRAVARDEIKRIREKLAEHKKAEKEYVSLIRGKAIEFKAAVAPHVAAITLLKQETMTSIKNAPVAKANVKLGLSYRRLLAVFAKKHTLGFNAMHSIFSLRRYGRTPESTMNRKFRIWI